MVLGVALGAPVLSQNQIVRVALPWSTLVAPLRLLGLNCTVCSIRLLVIGPLHGISRPLCDLRFDLDSTKIAQSFDDSLATGTVSICMLFHFILRVQNSGIFSVTPSFSREEEGILIFFLLRAASFEGQM